MYVAIFKGGNSKYTNYAYSFCVWTAEQCSNFFKKSFPPGSYFVMEDGLFHIRGPYINESHCIASVKDILISEDDAQFDSVAAYPGNSYVPVIMNEL